MAQATIPDDILAAMDAALRDEFERSARMRSILPEVEMPDARYGVLVPQTVTGGTFLSATTDTFERPVRLTLELRFDAIQADDEELAVSMAGSAARLMARTEDECIAYGSPVTTGPVTVSGPTNACLMRGQPTPVTGLLPVVVAEGATALGRANHYNPYGFAAAPYAWAEYLALRASTRQSVHAALGSEHVAPIGTDAATNPAPFGFMFAEDPSRLDLVRVQLPCGGLRGYTSTGDIRYFVESQFLLRVKDATAIAVLQHDGRRPSQTPCKCCPCPSNADDGNDEPDTEEPGGAS